MKLFLFIMVFFCAVTVVAQTPTISPINPVVQPGGTQTFSCSSNCGTGGTFTCANVSNGGTCFGSINSGTGVYTAPATYAACTSLGGYQLLPCDHIFNMNISGLPVNAGGTNLTITSATRLNNVVTLVLAGGGYTSAVNTLVTITGSSDATFNAANVAVGAYCGNTCLTYANSGSNASSTGGNLFVPYISGMGTIPVSFLPSFTYNYTNASTPTQALNFYYTPLNNATFEVPQWPTANIQGGWFGALALENGDHHLITIDTTNGNVGEQYQYYAQAPVTTCTVNGSNSATCTITPTNTSSGFQRMAAVGSELVELGSFTSTDTYLNGSFTLTAATPTSITFNITHAAASTSTTGQVTAISGGVRTCAIAGNCNSQSGDQYAYSSYTLPPNGSTTAAGNTIASTALRAEELVNACENGGSINHVLAITLANGYIANAHVWPALPSGTGGGGTTPYGLRVRLKAAFVITGFSACAQKILTALKNYGAMLTDGGLGWQINVEYGPLNTTEATALKAITAANIAVTNWEAVDVSGQMETTGSGATVNGEVVNYTSSTGTVTTNVALAGTAVDLPSQQIYVMAGTPAFQLTGYSAAGGITWSMSPTVGTLTSGGLYTAPASVTVGTLSSTTVTATSAVNGAVTSVMTINVCPATNCNFTQDTANFTDSHSVVWFGKYGNGITNAPSWQGCCQNDASFSNITDKQLWWNHFASSQTSGDLKMDFHVPNGTYTVTQNTATNAAVGADVRYFYGQGNLLTTVDSTSAAGGQHLPYTLTSTIVVSNGILSVYNAGIGSQSSNTGDISSMSFSQNSGSLGTGSVVGSGIVVGPNAVVK